ncbi:hypothetical protein [Thiorhodococcus mannitoliphagus]|uniref:hypothetical protein n=1 Tax=Thiorhodococcus mannitoliphagus TaxID=329406 RepID=UPI0013E0D7D4|nr:hypothetical protein [Thiorhodococcus mannitoliphagus]
MRLCLREVPDPNDAATEGGAEDLRRVQLKLGRQIKADIRPVAGVALIGEIGLEAELLA